ncbi:DUF3667 domain-containing protein [Maricaulis virginensis]|uniref:DUF3667 domain-containing protein n=1 Tax=Maricaulis virginensis TaxID=144022 RepID=A0A9W6IJI2_9PROT|nr:DUF3667 domain-containing protein [Maricaulis virginensis]GLK50644.1 hypothetical protein GCM10017621_01520 [Maricaulis virginensis]
MSGSDVVTDAVVGGSAAGELGDAIQSSRRRKSDRYSVFASPTPAGTCSNCATELSGPVCHSCGQASDTFHRPVWDLLLDVLDGLLGLEGRLWRTLPPLMFQPGKLTTNYLTGVRARYVMPFRLYLTASVLFFLAFFAVNEGLNTGPEPVAGSDIAEAREALETGDLEAGLAMMPEEARNEVIRQVERGLDEAENAESAETPEARELRQQAERNELKQRIRYGLLPEYYPREAAALDPDETVEISEGMVMNFDGIEELPLSFRLRLADGIDAVIDSQGQALWAAMKTWAPRLMFGLLPIYALLLAVTHFYKRGLYFYDHLVVTLHFHAFLFFMFLLVGVISLVLGPGWAVLVFFLWSNYYLYRLHRTVYSHGRFSSFLRVIFLDMVYLIILSFGLMVLVFVGLFTAS